MNKNEYKKQYENYSIEYLLELKARGSELDSEAHLAIEEILKEENIDTTNLTKANAEAVFKPSDKGVKKTLLKIIWFIVVVLLLGLSIGFARIIASTNIGLTIALVVAPFCILYAVYHYLAKKKQDK
jgi:hypothetical protein